MGVRCEKCGHDNDGKFLFCGMCGERLPSVQWQEEDRLQTESEEPGPNPKLSPDALTAPTSERVEADRAAYLLRDEDDEHPRHKGRLYLALVFLITSLVLMAIHWRPFAHGWLTAYVARSAATNPGEETPESSEAPPADTSASTQARPKAATKPVKPAVEPAAAPPVASVPVSTTALPADLPNQNSAAPPTQKQPSTEASATAPTSSGRRKAKTLSNSADDSQSFADNSPVAQGERYLYGNGVEQDCALARKNLSIAAERKNSRALTLMGTMYATGHCAPRDLPTAYGWFAQALHTDPSNHRVEDDLSLVWKQMTPGEKQIALKK